MVNSPYKCTQMRPVILTDEVVHCEVDAHLRPLYRDLATHGEILARRRRLDARQLLITERAVAALEEILPRFVTEDSQGSIAVPLEEDSTAGSRDASLCGRIHREVLASPLSPAAMVRVTAQMGGAREGLQRAFQARSRSALASTT